MTAPLVVGLDVSLTATGVAYFDGATRALRPPQGLLGAARLDWLERAVLVAVADAQLVVIEGYSMGSRTAHAHALGEAGGVVRLALWRAGYPYVDVSPATLKKYATGVGNASKEYVLAEAIRRLGYTGHDHNQADALWLRALALHNYGEPVVTMPKTNTTALRGIDWPTLDRA